MEPFIPAQLPIDGIDWEGLVPLIGRGNREIARYDGMLQGIPDPNVMLSPFTSQEAVLSSKIEGTRATLDDVLQHDAGRSPAEKSRQEDIFEIANYRSALQYAQSALKERKFSLGLLKELHQRLLSSVRGKNKQPGKLRTQQNWIGTSGSPIEEAFFIPPPPHLVQDYLDNFIAYYHLDRPDPLVQLAILHAQFEIIHPFDDGNGRLGRMLIPLFLYEKKILSEPMFYLSGYLERNREEYVARLRALGKEPTAWNAWIQFFLHALIEQANMNTDTTKKILSLYAELKRQVIELTHSQYSVPLLDYMFSKPVFLPADLARQTAMPSRAQLGEYFKKLKQAGIVSVIVEGRGRRPELLALPSLINLCEGRSAFYDPRTASLNSVAKA